MSYFSRSDFNDLLFRVQRDLGDARIKHYESRLGFANLTSMLTEFNEMSWELFYAFYMDELHV